MRRVFLALVFLVSALVAGCGLVRQGLPMEAQDAAPTGGVSRADAGRDAFRALDAGGDEPGINPPPSPTAAAHAAARHDPQPARRGGRV